MICFPNAKLNLGLSVIRRRPDYMHDIETCMIPIPLFDILEIKRSDRFSLTVEGTDLRIPQQENLISKTWQLLVSEFNNIDNVEVMLYKNIVPESGLGGGSSDAAFFLRLVNEFNSLGMTVAQMENLINKVGSDCPFFIQNIPAIASETGNYLQPVENPITGKYITIVIHGNGISTFDAYSNITPKTSPSIATIISSNIELWNSKLKNDFEEFAFAENPILQIIKDDLYNKGALFVSLSGTGSCIYAISEMPLNIKSFKNRFYVQSFVIG